jgi:hypothetical protein
MKKRRTPIGLIVGFIVALGVVFYVNVASHKDPTVQAADDQAAALAASKQSGTPPDATAEDLKAKVAVQFKGNDIKSKPSIATNSDSSKKPSAPLIKQSTRGIVNHARMQPKPKPGFAGDVYTGWYNKDSGVR